MVRFLISQVLIYIPLTCSCKHKDILTRVTGRKDRHEGPVGERAAAGGHHARPPVFCTPFQRALLQPFRFCSGVQSTHPRLPSHETNIHSSLHPLTRRAEANLLRSAGVTLSPESSAALELRACSLAARGDAARLARMIDAGVPATAADYDRRSALHLASAGGHLEARRAHSRLARKDTLASRDSALGVWRILWKSRAEKHV